MAAAILRFVGRPPVREMALPSFPLTVKSLLAPTTLWTAGNPTRSVAGPNPATLGRWAAERDPLPSRSFT
jgi:hypothetical protein